MFQVPHTLGRYTLLAELSSGGMATVFLARLNGAVGFQRPVAVKVLHKHFASDPEFVAMMLDEARINSFIRHPNVVAVNDVIAEGGQVCLVMEYVEGATIAAFTQDKPGHSWPSVGISLALAIDALRGLHAAHIARGDDGALLNVVHRDVSPQNLMVALDGTCRVLDFGIAKALGRSASTEVGQVKGKLRYMAPEQIGAGAVDQRTDLFALGVVLWELLTHRRLFAADSREELTRLVAEGPTAQQVFDPTLDPRVLRALAPALAAHPAERYSSASAMADALEALGLHASRSEVSAWVQPAAKAPHLSQVLATPSLPEVSNAANVLTRTVVRPIVPLEPTTPERQPARSASRRALLPALVVAGLAVGVGALVWRQPVQQPLAPPVAIDSPPAEAAKAPEIQQVAPVVAATVLPEPAVPVAAVPAAKPTEKKRKPPRATPAVDCSVPYELDSQGNPVFKRACLRP